MLVLLRRAPGFIALVLVAHLLLDIRPTQVANWIGDPFFLNGTIDGLEQLWWRLSTILALLACSSG